VLSRPLWFNLADLILATCLPARDSVVPIPDELLGHYNDANGRALELEPIEKNTANESLQFSFEEKSGDVVCKLSESLVRDVEKAAIEFLAAR
jgi:hypothetical protein